MTPVKLLIKIHPLPPVNKPNSNKVLPIRDNLAPETHSSAN